MNGTNRYEYYAFISYAPEDEKFAKWLQKNMESFRLPMHVQKSHQPILDKIGQFFVDKKGSNREAFAEMVLAELAVSQYLLVICTPAAAQSATINEEVRTFIANGRKEDIILLNVSGEPDALDTQKECLPVDIRELPKEERPILWDFQADNYNKSILSLIAYLMHVPEASLLHYNKKSKTLWRVVLYLFVSILVLTLGFLFEYNRVHYEYYVSYVDRWGIPEGIDSLTPEQAAAYDCSYRFEYRHTPISEGNPFEWRLVCVSCINGYGQLIKPDVFDYLPIEASCSVCKLEYYQGNIYSISYYNKDNQLVSTCDFRDDEGHPQGWVERRFHQGADGNMMEDGSEYPSALFQIPCIRVERDQDGYIKRISYHANNDRDVRRSAVCSESYSFGCDFSYDKKHRLVKMVFLSSDMNPEENNHGVKSVTCAYDETLGRMTDVYYNAKLDNFIEGISHISYKYDEKGNAIEVSYYDKKDAPCLAYISGVSVIKYRRGEHGEIQESQFFDQEYNPMTSKQGYAKACYVRDSQGNVLTTSYYDEKGNLTLMDGGFAIEKRKYNEDNQVIEWSYYGVDELPILNSSGYACVKFTYDAQNRKQSESYFDETDMPIEANKFQGARVEYEYGNDDHLLSESYYDVNGQPYVGLHGEKVVYKYDDRGNITEKTFYDDHGDLYVGVDKVAKFRYWYNDIGLQTEARCYGIDGKLTMHRLNFSIFRCGYDSLNRATYYAFFDKHEKPSFCESRKCVLVKQIYKSDRDSLIANIKYDWDGNEYVETEHKLLLRDYRGNIIRSQYLNSQGQRCLCGDGLSSWTVKYDQRGNRIECHYFGIDGNPSNIKGYNFASWKASYDYKDRRIEQSYYDIHGNLTVNNHGVSRWKAVYKDDENTPYMYYYDLAGNVISNDK